MDAPGASKREYAHAALHESALVAKLSRLLKVIHRKVR